MPPEGEARGLVAPFFSTTVAENPTITIVPMGGAEFTRRLLTPMDETRFLSVLQLGADLGMVLRMMASAMRLDSENGRDVLANEPGKALEYEEFRRRSLHLASLHEAHQLHIEPIMFEEVWAGPMARSPEPEDVIQALEKGYRWTSLGDGKHLLHRMRLVIANYPPSRDQLLGGQVCNHHRFWLDPGMARPWRLEFACAVYSSRAPSPAPSA